MMAGATSVRNEAILSERTWLRDYVYLVLGAADNLGER
jgi:hypothetical protein